MIKIKIPFDNFLARIEFNVGNKKPEMCLIVFESLRVDFSKKTSYAEIEIEHLGEAKKCHRRIETEKWNAIVGENNHKLLDVLY